MNTRQLNKLNMYLGVRRYVADPKVAEARGQIGGFQEAWDQFVPVVNEIHQQAVASRGLVTGGTTETKETIRESLAVAAAKISAGLVILAEVNGDAVLAEKAHVTKSVMMTGREMETAERADALLLLASAHVDHLGKYAVTQERLDRFELLCQEFSDLTGRPRAIILQRKTANRSFTELFQEADLHLSRMDRLCPSLEETHPKFVAGYRENRSIVQVNATRPLSDEELANAVRDLEEKQDAEARKAAAKASQDAEQAQRAAVREEMEEKLRVAKQGLPAPGTSGASSAPSDTAQAKGDRATTAPAVNFGLPS